MSLPPRRSSYASVLSGNVQSSNSSSAHPPQPTRAGFMAHLAATPAAAPSSSLEYAAGEGHVYSAANYHLLAQSEPTDLSRPRADFANGPWERPASTAYRTLSSTSHDALARSGYSGVLPSYMQGSRYIERLAERQRQRRLQQRDSRPSRCSNPASLSTSSSSMNLHKMVPSHRGMTHEIIERPSTHAESSLTELPSHWSTLDKMQGLDVSIDGLDVTYNGTGKGPDEAASVRADSPIPRDVGIYYYEVTVQGRHKEGLIGVGFSGPKCSLSKLPGWEADSWAYHGDDGCSFCQTPSGKQYGPRYGYMSTVGCGINFRTGTIFFTKDGVDLGPAFHDIRHGTIYPSVGMKKQGEHLRTNFGQSPFVYDIDGLVERERRLVRQQIERADPTSLSLRKNEDALLRDLVEQYLAHEGYVGTAKAFALEAQRRDKLLYDDAPTEHRFEFREDTDAIQRQRIRAALLEGDIDGALLYTQEYYPQVLRENENIDFKLKCRKFVEMIRRCSELSAKGKATAGKGATNGQNGLGTEFGVFDNDMEIDGAGQHDAHDGMDVDYAQSSHLMTDALMYGQQLQAEFRDDPRREVKQALEDTFALIAYTNAEESSLAPLLKADGRAVIAEELNSAILVWNGKSSSSAAERLLQQTEVLVADLAAEGHGAALINIGADYCREGSAGV